MNTLFLHDHPVSPFACKIRILCREKSLRFDSAIPPGMGMGHGVPAIVSANPREEIPVLEDREAGISIFDSTIIAQYLEDKWPEPAMMPARPEDRARARMIEEIADTSYEAINWGYGEVQMRAEGPVKERLLEQIERQLNIIHAWLEAQLGESGYFNGSAFGWADMCVAPVLGRSMSFGIGPAEGTRLYTWFTRVSERPSIKLTLAELLEGAKIGGPAMRKAFMESGPGVNRRQYRDHRLEWMIKSGGLELVLEGLKSDNVRFGWPNAN